MDAEPIVVFLSHSSKEKALAGQLKQSLEEYGFDAFVAHDDIIGGENWMSALFKEIKRCDVFLILLSKEYHRADYTDQEVGIAYSLKKHIIPLSIDGTLPYGFMSKYQAVNAKDGIDQEKLGELAHTIYISLRYDMEILDSMIQAYENSNSFNQANRRAEILFLYEESFDKIHNNEIAKAFLANRQINEAYRARSLTLRHLEKYQRHLTPEHKEKLQKWFKQV